MGVANKSFFKKVDDRKYLAVALQFVKDWTALNMLALIGIFFLLPSGHLGHVLLPTIQNFRYPQFVNRPDVWYPITNNVPTPIPTTMPVCPEVTTPMPETTTSATAAPVNTSTPIPVVPVVGVLDPGGNRDTPSTGYVLPFCPQDPKNPTNLTPSIPPIYISIFLNQDQRAEIGAEQRPSPPNIPINITVINYLVNQQEHSPIIPIPYGRHFPAVAAPVGYSAVKTFIKK